ncbi:DUF1643 domain-containing protein [Halorubrum sp. Ea1]|uniref:DUF1643 domain-containing protein n=1 Tax=Halorubrum sp. Ea1 TaxID=1480718 RepID=UPI001595D0C5|nr:DUF1643 domain-containing protein [Halorubrum sp. Ea1]
MDSDAVLSPDRVYRYRLSRTWDRDNPTLGFIMLNPSTADESEDDNTIRRCLGYAKDWGYGSILVGNLFAYRATDRSQLREYNNPIGPKNDEHLRSICEEVDMTVAAWGTDGALYNRGPEVVEMLDADLYALNRTKEGHPNHPLYQPKDAEPEPFDYGSTGGD